MDLTKPIQHLPTGNIQVVKARVTQARLNMSPNQNLVLSWRFRPEPIRMSDGSLAQLTFHRQDRNRQPLEMTELFETKTFQTDEVTRTLDLARSRVRTQPDKFSEVDIETIAESELTGASLIAFNFLNDMLKSTEFFNKLGKEISVDPSTSAAMSRAELVELDDKIKLDFDRLDLLHDIESGKYENLAKVMAAMVGEEVQIMVRLSPDNLHTVSAVYHPNEKISAMAGLQTAQRALITSQPVPARANRVLEVAPHPAFQETIEEGEAPFDEN